MRRVAFTLIGGGKGTGGYNYLLNLLCVLCTYEAARIQPVLFLGTDVAADEAAAFKSTAGLEIIRSPVLNRARRFATLAKSLLLGVDGDLQALFRGQRIDVVFESAQFFGWRLGLPVVAWIPDFQHRHLRHMFTSGGYWRRELGFQVEIAAGRTIMLSSEDARHDCERFYPRTAGRTRVVRFAVPPGQPPSLSQARAVADSYGLPAHFLFMPNQFSRHKNHLLVLDALASLRSRGVDVVVVSSGKQLDERHPDYFAQFKARLDALGLHSQLRLLGLIPYADLVALMRASAGLLNPSLFEGWSTPVEEARALGVPLLLSDLDVNREQAGYQARYFNRHSAEELADAIAATPELEDAQREQALDGALQVAQTRVRQFAADFAQLMTGAAAGPYAA
jgi:glycosyltransferase involved in cell wall biosynthesis